MKRYIYIIIGIVVVAAIAVLVLFLIKNNSATNTQSSTGTATGSLPAAGTQGTGGAGGQNSATPIGTLGLTPTTATGTVATGGQAVVQSFGVLSSQPVLDYFVDAQNTITAIEPNGAIMTVTGGQSTILNSSTINDIISAGFSYDGKKILVSYGDPANPHAEIFTVATNAWTALPQGMFSPTWSPINNYLIAYLAAPSAGKLVLSTINAANPKAAPSSLLSLSANDLTVQWPTKTEFILSDKPASQNAGSILAFNSQAGTLTPLIYEVPGAEAIWSHNATIPYGLVFFNNGPGQGNTLQLRAISGSLPTQTLGFATLPSKCGFNTELMTAATSTASSTTTTTTPSSARTLKAPTKTSPTPYLALYCGIPRNSSEFSSARLPDDYNMMSLFTSDDIFKINLTTGAMQPLWSDATQNMDVSDVKFFNNVLFFVNRYDQKLYGLTFAQ